MDGIEENLERLRASKDPDDNKVYEFIHKTEKMLQMQNDLRGHYISWSITLESLLEEIIATRFGVDVRSYELMTSLILKELMLSKKIKILNKLLKHEYLELLSNYSSLKARLEKIAEFRNDMAHDSPFFDVELLTNFDGESIYLTRFEDDKKTYRRITKQEMDKEIAVIQRTCADLMTILHFVRKKKSTLKVISIEIGENTTG